MVPVINSSKSYTRALKYNENKVEENKAELLMAKGYAKDIEMLGFSYKLKRLENQAALHPRAERTCMHISLNFHPSEKLDKDTLCRIAESYMEKIGFFGQPFLMYEHRDAGHPHIHIVSTNIRPDGTRIKTQNIGRNQSTAARHEIDREFGLIRADGREETQHYSQHIANVYAVKYGARETKQEINKVLNYVLDRYRFTTLNEYNSVLRQFNVSAERGSKDSRTYQRNGLVYRMLDEEGKRIGKPIKASDFHQKPTLKFLENKFTENAALRLQHKRRIMNAVDMLFFNKVSLPIEYLKNELRNENIQLHTHINKDGVIYGMTYIDHKSGAVFNGSSLGVKYSSNAIQKRCEGTYKDFMSYQQHNNPNHKVLEKIAEGIQEVTEAEKSHLSVAYELLQDAKKRKRKLKH